MRYLAAVLFALLFGSSANAQVIGGGVTQSGLITINDCVKWIANGQIGDSGGACGGGSSGLSVGTTAITGGTANGLLFDSAGVLGNLATANNGVLVTSAGGVPSISSTLPSGLTIPGYATSGATLILGSTTLTLGQTTTAVTGLASIGITAPGANTTPLSITSGSITGSSTVSPGISVTGTLNTTGVVDGAAFFANITNTASSPNSIIMDLQIGGVSKFSVPIGGGVTTTGALNGTNLIASSGHGLVLRGGSGSAIIDDGTVNGIQMQNAAGNGPPSAGLQWFTNAAITSPSAGALQTNAMFVLKAFTVGTLPTGITGATAYVTDAVACTFLATLTGGGSTVCPVFFNGSAWVGA